jgi:3-hydroxy-D-aspartate aldolase
MSVNLNRKTAVIDAGLKASSFDSGPPLIGGPLGKVFDVQNGGDEHGVLVSKSPEGASGQDLLELPKVGDVLRLIPGHCDPTVNLHDFLVGVRKGRVEEVWEVSGRGPGF